MCIRDRNHIASALRPLMQLAGLPGEAALVYLSGALLNNYSAIAVMSTLSLSLRDATILALMCLTSHNLPVESAVMKSIGSSALKMTLLRIGTAIAGGVLLNLLLPASLAQIPLFATAQVTRLSFWPMLAGWAVSTARLIGKIVLYLFILMLVQSLFERLNLMEWLSRWLGWLMRLFGLRPSMAFLWIVINIVGYSYGAGVIRAACEEGKMSREEGDLFNHHAAICHSLVEDSVLYSALSIPLFWIVVPRIGLAMAVVWGERLRRTLFISRDPRPQPHR
ncbi:MAG: transporter, partial [Rectinema sp.]|nr:transporter [Rectinema sp.]